MSATRTGDARHVAIWTALAANVGIGALAGTQWIASRLAYLPILGRATYVVPVRGRRWCIAVAVALAGIAAASLLAHGWRRVSPIVTLAAVACAWMARCQLIYAPWSIIVWHWQFRHSPHLTAIVQTGWEIAAVVSVLLALSLIPLLLAGGAPPRTPRSQGTAAWESGGDLVAPNGLLIGWQDSGTRGRE